MAEALICQLAACLFTLAPCWDPDPPLHTPTFVLTHHPRPSIEMEGGTVFHFIDASPAEAMNIASEAAGDRDVRLGGSRI
jgi:dihydrofolate reductase